MSLEQRSTDVLSNLSFNTSLGGVFSMQRPKKLIYHANQYKYIGSVWNNGKIHNKRRESWYATGRYDYLDLSISASVYSVSFTFFRQVFNKQRLSKSDCILNCFLKGIIRKFDYAHIVILFEVSYESVCLTLWINAKWKSSRSEADSTATFSGESPVSLDDLTQRQHQKVHLWTS